VLPVALLVSLLFTLGQMHRQHETTALLAAGVGIGRMTRVLWLAGLLLGGVLFYLNARLVPWSVEEARRIRDSHRFASELATVANEDEVGLLYNLTFNHHRERRLWFLNRFNEYNYRAFGITVSELDAQGRELRRTMAGEGWYEERPGCWTLLRGRKLEFDPVSGEVVRSLAFANERFAHFTEPPDLMKFLEKRPKDLSLYELGAIVAALDPREDPRAKAYAVQYYGVLFNPLSCLLVVGFAVPFALSGVRTNPFVGVAKASGLFGLYYVAVQAGDILGRGGLDPLWAALLPNGLALAAAVWFYRRAQFPA
jgi:lipopolysaccharide export system permease protein